MTAPTTASPFWRSPGFVMIRRKLCIRGFTKYGSFDDLMLSFARLKDLGIEPEFCLNHGVATSLYYADPDQNLVELQVDIFGNWDASAEWMRKSEDFRQNPDFSTQTFFAAHKAGATFEQLQKDTYAGNIPLRNRQTSMSLRADDFLTRVARSARSASEIPLEPICEAGPGGSSRLPTPR
jgi:hypothetical protein